MSSVSNASGCSGSWLTSIEKTDSRKSDSRWESLMKEWESLMNDHERDRRCKKIAKDFAFFNQFPAWNPALRVSLPTPFDLSDQVHPQTRSRLLAMVGGDVSVADRLVAQMRSSNPAMSNQFAYKAVIERLLRDRSAL